MRVHRIVAVTVALTLGMGCAGPEASDAAVCADLIHRICLPPVCGAVVEQVGFSGDCEPALLANTGCGDPNFRFETPTRQRFLQCRTPLLREGAHVDQPPACEDVTQSLEDCPDLVAFLRGEGP